MTNDKTTSLAAMALDAWGNDAQIVQAMEEAGELIVALSHWRRGRGEAMDLATEVADLEIMLEQVALILRRHDGDGSTLEAARRKQRAKARTAARRQIDDVGTAADAEMRSMFLRLGQRYGEFGFTVQALGGDPEAAIALMAMWHVSGGTMGMPEVDIIDALRRGDALPEVPS